MTAFADERWLEPDRDSVRGQPLLRLAHAVVAVVEDRGAEDGVGLALGNRLAEVRELPGAAGGDHRHPDRVGNGFRQLEVVAVVGAVAVYARQQDLPRSALDRLCGPGDGVAPRDPLAAAVDVDAPLAAEPAGR